VDLLELNEGALELVERNLGKRLCAGETCERIGILEPGAGAEQTTVSLPSKRPAAASAVAPASATAPARLDERVGGMREPRLRVPDLLTGHLDQMAARRTHRVDDVGRVEERPHLKPGDRRRDGLVEQCRRADERPADGGRAIRLYGNEPGRAVELRRPVEEPLPRGREEAAVPQPGGRRRLPREPARPARTRWSSHRPSPRG
jgi:hypothetical protein